MFFEYAVDPRCFADWDSFKPLRGQFGWKQGRLISNFPKNWKRKVHEVIEENNRNNKKLTFMQSQRITDELDSKIFIKSNGDYSANNGDWLSNAVHNIKAFHAIIAYDNQIENNAVLIASELDLYQPLWKVEFTDIVESSPDQLCKCVEKLLKQSSKILFIDPYFFKRDNEKDKERWLVTLKKFIEVAKKKNTVFEYHLEISDNEYLKKPDKRKEDFQMDCNNSIKNILPFGIKITLYRWKKIDHTGDKFHARYILTDLGGVWFDVGLDKGKSGETTNVARLEDKVWKTRLDSFKEENKVYDFVDEVEVVGE